MGAVTVVCVAPRRNQAEETSMPIIPADRLTNIGSTLLQAAGASKAEGDTVAKGCVAANLAGHDSHGVIAIPTYIDRMGKGHIVPGAPFRSEDQQVRGRT